MTQEESIERFNQRAELEHNLIEARYTLSSTDYKILKIYEARICLYYYLTHDSRSIWTGNI